MSFTSIGSFNSGILKGGVINTPYGITVVNYYTEAYISWNPVFKAINYQIAVTGGVGGNTYTTANTYQLFTGLAEYTNYTFSIRANFGAKYGPNTIGSFTTLKLPTYNTINAGTVSRSISPNGIDSVWTFIDGSGIDFNLFSDICLNIIGVGAGSPSVLSNDTGTYIGGGGGGEVRYTPFRVYDYYSKFPSNDSSYNLSINVGSSILEGQIQINGNSSFYDPLNPNYTDPFTPFSITNGSQGNSTSSGDHNTIVIGGNNSLTAGGGGAGTGSGIDINGVLTGAGGDAFNDIGGNGGPGIGFTINNVLYGPYGGGGGGYGSVQSGLGGIGGGGNGGDVINGNGVPNTGGGAGGTNSATTPNQGGSGVVVIVGTTSLLPSIVTGFSYGNLVANSTTSTYSLDISYNQSVQSVINVTSNVAGYCVQFNGNVKNTSGNIGNSFVFNSSSLSSSYSGFFVGNTYTISAYAIGTYGNSISSNTITILPFTLPPSGNLVANTIATTANSISFSFTAPTTTIGNYSATAIDVSNSASIFYANNISSNVSSATITGLVAGNAYYISMKTINSYGTSISSNTLTWGTLPNPVTGLSYGNTVGNATTSTYSVDISYNKSSSIFITGYCIQFSGNVKNASGTIGNTFVVNSSTTRSNYSGLNGGNTYTISAYVVGTYGNSAFSNISISPFTLPPTNLSANINATTENSISFSFTAPTTTVTSYSATAFDVSNSSFIIYANNISASATNATIGNLVSGNVYNISMKTINTYGISISSNPLIAATKVLYATGGTFSIVGSYAIHKFTTNDTFKVLIPNKISSIDILLVGGGGTGGAHKYGYRYGAGGGGGGQVFYKSSYTITDISYNISPASPGGVSKFSKSDNTVIYSASAGGNGGGAIIGSEINNAADGSSGANGGGGGTLNRSNPISSNGGTGTNGYSGGNSSTSYSKSNSTYYYKGGGGGGAGGAGGVLNAGVGLANSITGTQVYYGAGGHGSYSSSQYGNYTNISLTSQTAAQYTGYGGNAGSNDGGYGVIIIRYTYP